MGLFIKMLMKFTGVCGFVKNIGVKYNAKMGSKNKNSVYLWEMSLLFIVYGQVLKKVNMHRFYNFIKWIELDL